jgi:hypothetical protein
MTTFTITFTPQQLQVLNAALGEMPFRVAAPLIQHINAEIQRQHEAWGDTRTPSGATIPPAPPTED